MVIRAFIFAYPTQKVHADLKIHTASGLNHMRLNRL